MLVRINAGTVQNSEALEQKARDEVDNALRHITERVTRVEVHLNDENAHKAGPQDKHCTIEARVGGYPPIAVAAKSDDLYDAITAAGHKLSRAVSHKLGKLAAR